MVILSLFRDLTRFERSLWLSSAGAILLSCLLFPGCGAAEIAASLIGVTSLIFIAKGYVFGQVLMIVFGLLYGAISLGFRYYGEMITYVGMTVPIAALTAVEWLRHPYAGTREVTVSRMSRLQKRLMLPLTAAVTAVFAVILQRLGNANLALSVLSIATSFAAAYMTFCRSPYYALGYALNDVVLIALWALAAMKDVSCLPMFVCFLVFLINDLYGLYSWKKMERRQANHA